MTDYIRKEYEKAIGNTEYDVNSLGVLPFFEMLRRDNEKKNEQIRFGVLCGTIVIIPAEAREALEQAIGMSGKVTFSRIGNLSETDYLKVTAVGNAAKGKLKLLENNFAGYVLMSILAGMYIALGSILMGIVGGVFTGGGAFSTKLACGIVFSVGLCFVTMAGAELFTGNNLVMTIGGLKKTVSWGGVVKLWVVCWIGNLIGSVVSAAIFTMTGIPGSGDIGAFFANAAAGRWLAAQGVIFQMMWARVFA